MITDTVKLTTPKIIGVVSFSWRKKIPSAVAMSGSVTANVEAITGGEYLIP